MPLSSFQLQVARLLSDNRSPHSHLAGGAAILSPADSPRFSVDLDYFQDSTADVAKAYRSDTSTLLAEGFSVITHV